MAAETMRITEELVVKDKTSPGVDRAQEKVSAFDRTVKGTQDRLDRMSKSRWSVAFHAVDKATSVLTKVEGKMSRAIGKAWNFTVGVIDKATGPLRGIFNMLRNPLLQAGAVLGISVSVGSAISTFGAFEGKMSEVKAISGATAAEMADLTALAKEMGATTKFTAEEAAQGLTYMAMAGWKTDDMMTSLSGVMNLAAASGEDLGTVSDIVTDAMTAFGLAADGVTATGVSNAMHFSDVLAAASSNSNTNVSMMGETFKYVGSMAGALGYNIEDVALATGLMANSGIKGTMSGTALNAMLTRLSTNTSGAADAIAELGVNFYNSDGSARKLGDVMGELRRATVNMTAAEKSELANTVAGMEAQKGLLAILNTSEQDYAKLTEAIYNADGAAEQMSGTMLDNMAGSLTLLQSAVDGVKLALGSRLSPYVRQFADWLTTKMPNVEETINEVMDSVDGKIRELQETIGEFTSSEEWANADIWGKIGIAWDKIVAEPFSAWWDTTGKPWLTEKMTSFGETLGSGITTGLLALLGFDASGAVDDGKAVGEGFIQGFKDGFDTDLITEALENWANDHKGVVAAAGVIAGGKLLGGIAKAFQASKNIFGMFGHGKGSGNTTIPPVGGGGNPLQTYTTSTMTVTAGTVIVNSANVKNPLNNMGGGGIGTALTGGGAMALPAAGKMLGLPGAGPGPLALPGAAPIAPMGAGLTGAGSWLSKLLLHGSTSSVVAADGTLLAVQGGVGGTLSSLGAAYGSTATTAAGTAAAGAAGTGGILGMLFGGGKALVDLFQGIGHSNRGESKAAKDEYMSAGAGAGMMAAGAGIGAGIGALFGGVGAGPGALIGGGIGGIASLFASSPIGKWLSDATDEGGVLDRMGKSIGGFFTETLPTFVTETIPEVASDVGEAIGEWAAGAGEAIGGFFTETVPSFFTETIPYAAGYVYGTLETFFGETVPQFFSDMWTGVRGFFTETLPSWAESVHASVSTFFGETVPEFFGNVWTNVSGFFTETLPSWAETVHEKVGTFFGETVPEFFVSLWDDISGFFTETLPSWAETAYGEFTTFFGETIPGFFSSLWDSISGFVTETLPSWGASISETVSGWWDSISGWFGSIWDSVSGWFTAGYEDATGVSGTAGTAGTIPGVGPHAEGGIMHAPHIGLVAEDGPEAIVPLGASSRTRGKAIWEQAGAILGTDDDDAPAAVYSVGRDTAPQETTQGNNVNVPVQISLNPEIIIRATEGMDPDDIVRVMKSRIRELVDDISDEMAERLARIFANMPLKGGV